MATRTWDNGAGTQNWEDANNWSGNTVPVTGDTAIIPTGMGTIAGTPSADVLAEVTIQGDSMLNVLIAATHFTFEGTSLNLGVITGDCDFTGNGSSNSGTGVINGNAVFSGQASDVYNAGSINGDAEFSYTGTCQVANNNPFGTVSGTTTISGNLVLEYAGVSASFGGNTSTFTITGSLAFVFSGDGSFNNGTITGNVTFSGINSFNDNTITGDCTFSGDGSFNNGTITGNAEWTWDGTLNTGGYTNPFGTVSTNPIISGNLVVEYSGNNEYFDGDTTTFNITGSLAFVFSGQNSYNGGIIVANCTFSGQYSYNNAQIMGNCTFSGIGSYNHTGGTITGNAYCTAASSFLSGTITGDVYFQHENSFPQNLTLTGNAIFTKVRAVEYTFANNLFSNGLAPFTAAAPVSIKFPFADIVGTGLL